MSSLFAATLPLQLLALAACLQLAALVAVLCRGGFGSPQGGCARWPFALVLLGGLAGIFYAWMQRDLLLGAAQGVALLIGFHLSTGPRPARLAAKDAGRSNGD